MVSNGSISVVYVYVCGVPLFFWLDEEEWTEIILSLAIIMDNWHLIELS